MKASILTIVLSVFLILSFPAESSAMGDRENKNAYKTELQKIFDQSIESIYNDRTDALTAKNRIETLRNDYNISYTDESGILDAIIDRAAEKSFTKDESHFYFSLLKNGKLMEYRKENAKKQSELHHREVLSLLLQNIESEAPEEPDAESLRAILNNYYDFLGLEYDEEYFKLSDLIYSLKEHSVDADEITAALDSMNRELIRKLSQRQSHTAGSDSNPNQSGSQASQQSTVDKTDPGTSGSSSRPGNSGESSQKPAGSGPGSRN